MMKTFTRRKKKCRFCHQWYQPYAHTLREQIACFKTSCQAQRRSHAWKRWYAKNSLYDQSRLKKKKQWADQHGAAYMRAYRKKKKGYASRNRRLQQRRDARRRHLVKTNAYNSVWHEKLRRIRSLGLLVKTNTYSDVTQHQIDGLCRVLEQSPLLVKPNAKDKR